MDVILHIGAGQGGQLEEWLASGAQRIVLFEPHPGLAKRLTRAWQGKPSVSVVPRAIAAEAGARTLQEYNLPEANSLRAPTALKRLFPGLKHINDYPVQAITPDQMMAEYGPAENASASLVIEAPGEAHAILQPLMENDLLDRFAELSISMTVAPCYQGSVASEQTLEALRDYGFDVVSHDDQDPDWPHWVLQRNPLKVELKKLQHRLSQAEQEKAEAGQHSRQLEQQLTEQQAARKSLEQEYKKQQQTRESEQAKSQQEHDGLKKQLTEQQAAKKTLEQEYKTQQQARESEQAKTRQEHDGLKKQLAEQQSAKQKLEQEYKKQQQALGQAEEKFQKTHRFFMVRKEQALEGEETIKALRAEYKRLEKANTGLQEELTEQQAAKKALEQEYEKQQQALRQAKEQFQKTHGFFMHRKQQAIKGEETIETLRAEHSRLEKAKTGLQEELTALKAELSEKTTQSASLEASLGDYQQRYTQGLLAPVRDVSQVDVKTARQWYQHEGALTDTLRALESLRLRGETLDEDQQAFQAKIEGLLRLKSHFQLPPHAAHPALASTAHQVLYCLHQSVPHATNGYATRSHGIATGLRQAGFNISATTRPGFPWDAGATDLNTPQHSVEVEGITYLAVEGSNLAKTPLDHYLEEAAEHFESQARACSAEVIAAASNHITALPALIAARRLGLPFVYEVRGLWEVTQASNQPAWAESEHYQLMRQLEQQTAREADWVIALTDELADELASWGVPRERIEVVPNAVNAERFQPMAPDAAIAKELNLQAGVPVIGYAGSAVAYEGLELLVEAMAKLKQSGQAFTFVLVGDGKVIDTVKAKAKELGIEGECRFTGRVPFEEVPRYLSCMDILPIPRLSSAVTEMVSALKPLEAMAMGKAVVLSDVSPHGVMAGVNGERARLFTKDSAESLSDALQALIDNPEERQRLGQAARAWIKQERTWDKVALKYAEGVERVRSERLAMLSAEAVHITPKQLTLNGNSKKTVENVIKVPSPGATLELSAAVVYRLKSATTTRKAALLFDFLDKDGNKKANIPGIGVAAAFKQHFRYLNANSKSVDDKVQEVFKLALPEDVTSVSLSVGSLGIKDDEQIELSIQGRCYSEEAEKERKRQLLQRQPLPAAIVHDPQHRRLTSDLTVACVLDEFTAECLSHEVKLVKVTQEAWQAQLEQNPPDFLLVESCWKGNDGNWGTITRGSGGAKKLSGLLRYCKTQGIPSVFWNKEDPPHYDKFGPIAKFFDLAITTDINMVPRYKEDFGIDVYPLSFGAQPKVHNPEPVIPRLEKAVFAGSYYGDKPKRCEDFNAVMGQLERAEVQYDIFDRNYQKGIEKFFFPDHYQANIVGNLPPEEVWKAHKGYKYQVNMNSVQDSATMFARRVYESLASGTPVVSNDSVGVRELFGDIVIMPGEKSIAEQLSALEASPQAYQTLARRGVRAVMREHTYGHRVQELCQLLGMNVEVDLPEATLAIIASSEADIQRAKQLFDAQTAQRKRLFIELENFDTAYQFLNKTDDTVTYVMRLAHELYANEREYYGSERVLKHDVNMPLPSEALEDFVYWGPGEGADETFKLDKQEVSA